jgi:predicted porin
MRKTLSGAALASVSLISFGQTSTVTLYGAADSFVGSYRGSASSTRLTDGGIVASQLGFRGKEDLGGGTSAVFDMQAGISLDSGTGTVPATGTTAGGLQFTRQSFVGLSGTWGALTLGRQYTPYFRGLVRYDPLGNNASFSTSTLTNQTEGLKGYVFGSQGVRAENAVLYVTPESLPVEVQVMVAPGGASNSSGNYSSALIGYKVSNFNMSYAFQQKKSGSSIAVVAAPTTSTSQIVGFSYTPQNWMFGGSYAKNKVDTAGALNANVLNLGARINFAGNQSVNFAWSRRDLVGSPNDTKAYAIRYDYLLSKRTTLYAGYLALKNSGKASIATNLLTINANSGDSGGVALLGILHRF